MTDAYQIDRLTQMSKTFAHLSAALAALKKAHANLPQACGNEKAQLWALAKLVDARRMSVHERVLNIKHTMETTK